MNHAPLQVDARDRGLDKPGGPQKGPDGEGAMADVKRPGKNLKQQWRHEQEVVPADENDFDIRAALAKRVPDGGPCTLRQSHRRGSQCVSSMLKRPHHPSSLSQELDQVVALPVPVQERSRAIRQRTGVDDQRAGNPHCDPRRYADRITGANRVYHSATFWTMLSREFRMILVQSRCSLRMSLGGASFGKCGSEIHAQ